MEAEQVEQPSGIVAEADWPVLTGPRLTLRVLQLSDVDAWLAGDDVEQQRWFEAPGPSPRANVVAAIATWRHDWATAGQKRHWGIWVDGELAGGLDVDDRGGDDRGGDARGDGAAYLSYVIFPDFRRRGLALEAIGLVNAWALAEMPVRSVAAVIDELNVASRSTVEHAGFMLEGPARPDEADESGVMLRYRWRPAAG